MGDSFLSIAVDIEKNSGSNKVDDKLHACLIKWNEIKKCTFATAFKISNNIITQSYPPDIIEQNSDKARIKEFFDILRDPKKNGLPGSWPWDLLREERHNASSDKGVIFPYELSITNSLTDLPVSTEELFSTINSAFKESHDHKELSWKWYGIYLAQIGDMLRADKKNTKYLVYILGTRKEFLARNRNTDYGLIVGFPENESANINHYKNEILAAWNLLVVAEHILEDQGHIASLEAARSMSHTFRTVVEGKTIPTVGIILKNNEEEKEKVINEIGEIKELIDLMGFVARKGIQNNISTVDVEKYNIVNEIKNIIEVSCESDIEYMIKPTIRANGDDKERIFFRRIYLNALFQEILSNVRKYGIKEENIINIEVNIIVDSKELQINISNMKNTPNGETYERTHRITGIENIKNIVEAMGGKIEYPKDDNNKYKQKITYPISTIEAKIIAQVNNTEKLTSKIYNVSKEYIPFNKRDEPVYENISLRILLLDDQLANINDVALHQQVLSVINKEKTTIEYYVKRINSIPYYCLWFPFWGIEMILCRSIYSARGLFDEDIDICLIDVDFKYDFNTPNSEPAPSLGGVLPALVFSRKKNTLVHIFTAVNNELKKDSNYSYIIEGEVRKHLGNLYIHDKKNIDSALPEAFLLWCKDIVPKQYDIDLSHLVELSQYLNIENNGIEPPSEIKLYDTGQKEKQKVIKGKLFEGNDKGGLIRGDIKEVTKDGDKYNTSKHEIMRSIAGPGVGGSNAVKEFSKSYHHQILKKRELDDFKEGLRSICKIFNQNFDEYYGMVKEAGTENEAKKLFRYTYNKYGHCIYMLSESEVMKKMLDEINKFLIIDNSNGEIHYNYINVEIAATKIAVVDDSLIGILKIYGNRNSNINMEAPAGCSLPNITKGLEIISPYSFFSYQNKVLEEIGHYKLIYKELSKTDIIKDEYLSINILILK